MAVRRPGSYEDIVALPEHLVGELIDGELFVQSRPAAPHTETASVLTMDLGSAFHRGRGGPGGWILLDEPELHLRKDVLVPDLAAWRRERLPEVPSAAFLTLAPDWVCEVLSPSTARKDRHRAVRRGAGRELPARRGVRRRRARPHRAVRRHRARAHRAVAEREGRRGLNLL